MHTSPLTHLGSLHVDDFLRDYWQKKPLLIRQAFPNYEAPIDANELAGLALEEDAEARLILEEGNTPWEMRTGPFQERDFDNLPKNKWTLLVQAVDHWVPEVAELLEYFKFIPSWRLDDIMISYAADGGSVGPHFDQYDVFLLQGRGKRRWKTGQTCTQSSPTVEGTPLHILQDFHCENDWLLEPGDMLYIPPQVAHWGTAVGDDCMTLSVGFRAPSHSEIVADFVQEKLSDLNEDHRYSDASLTTQNNPGEINTKALQQVRDISMDQLDQPEKIADWFGRYMTQPKYDWTEELGESGFVLTDFKDHELLYRNPAARFAYSGLNAEGKADCDRIALYVNGELLSCTLRLAKLLCASTSFTVAEILQSTNDQDRTMMNELLQQGMIVPDTTDEDEWA